MNWNFVLEYFFSFKIAKRQIAIFLELYNLLMKRLALYVAVEQW